MSLIEINRNPSPGQLKAFGLTWLVFFGALACGISARAGSPRAAMAAWAVALIVPAAGWIAPGFMRWVYLGMAYLAFPVGLVISHLILAVVWCLVFTPVGLVMRLAGYDPLARRFDHQSKTYWTPREAGGDVRRYFRQF